MKKTITLIVSEDSPVKHLLNSQDWDILTCAEDENTFALSRKETKE